MGVSSLLMRLDATIKPKNQVAIYYPQVDEYNAHSDDTVPTNHPEDITTGIVQHSPQKVIAVLGDQVSPVWCNG